MVDLCFKPLKACSSTAADSAMVGMVISGRASRACDVCGKERARWYCAADLAYLCQHCDGAVHSANAVAGRHERVRLGPNGKPVRVMQTSPQASEPKQEASDAHPVAPHPASSHFNPRKRPRSIRRHKPSSLHASKHVLSSSTHPFLHNRLPSPASECNNYMGSILASTHGLMIDNPRSNPDFISNDEGLTKCFAVKTEPYSPPDVGDQVKVPVHVDADDQLFESLFDFRDMQDDHLFLHQVPVYNPLHFTENLPATGEEEHYEKRKPIINFTMASIPESPERNQCSNAQSHELSETDVSEGMYDVGSMEAPDGAPPTGSWPKGDDIVEPDSGDPCNLDQLDFDCILEGNDDDSDLISHAPSNMEGNIDSHDFISAYSDSTSSVDDGGYTGVTYDNRIDFRVDDLENHGGTIVGLDYDESGREGASNWQCDVKVESSSELGIGSISQGSFGDEHDAALLKEKLTCRASSVDSSHLSFRLGLELNFEDVLAAWSNRGSFWMEGHAPSHVANCLDFLGGFFVPQMNAVGAAEGAPQPQLVTALNLKNRKTDGGAREASVLRYREKRHSRLFAKKIRYEVRKLNAEKRPRMKGRFVKRIVAVL